MKVRIIMSSFSEFDVIKLQKSQHCPICGGTVSLSNGVCPYCENESKEIKEKLSELEKMLAENMHDLPLDKTNTNNLILLQSIEPEVRSNTLKQFLKLQKIAEKIQVFMKKINDKISTENPLTEEENTVFTLLLNSNILAHNQIMGHEIMKSIFLKRPLVNEDTFLSLVKEIGIETMKEVNNDRIPNYKPQFEIKHLEKNTTGSAFECFVVNLDYNNLLKVYNGDILKFQTFFHEICHIIDDINISTGQFSLDIVKHIQEKIIKKN